MDVCEYTSASFILNSVLMSKNIVIHSVNGCLFTTSNRYFLSSLKSTSLSLSRYSLFTFGADVGSFILLRHLPRSKATQRPAQNTRRRKRQGHQRTNARFPLSSTNSFCSRYPSLVCASFGHPPLLPLRRFSMTSS